MKHCNKCGTRLEDDGEFCPECGAKTGKNKESKNVPKTRKVIFSKKMLYWSIPIIILILLVCIIVPTKTVSYTVSIPYESQEEYTEYESYTSNECKEVEWSYQIDTVGIRHHQDAYDQIYIDCKLKNLESIEGTFKPAVKIDGKVVGANWQTLQPGADVAFHVADYIEGGHVLEYSCFLSEIPYIEKCEDKVRERPVTKYRNVTKNKEETKYKKVNWLFGFEVPW